jgi:hypothetical protein
VQGNPCKREFANKESSLLRRTQAGLSGTALALELEGEGWEYMRRVHALRFELDARGNLHLRRQIQDIYIQVEEAVQLKWPSENIESKSK